MTEVQDRASTQPDISDTLREFLDDEHFATVATLDADGSPRQVVIWYTLDGDEIILNSRVGRHWPTNLLRDPRVSISVTDRHSGYRWVGLSGQARTIRDQTTAQADIAAMSRRYHADDPELAERLIRDVFERQERISFRIPIADVFEYLG